MSMHAHIVVGRKIDIFSIMYYEMDQESKWLKIGVHYNFTTKRCYN